MYTDMSLQQNGPHICDSVVMVLESRYDGGWRLAVGI